VITDAVQEVSNKARKAFAENDFMTASSVEPLEEVIDDLRDALRTRHIRRLQRGECSIEAGFVWSDLLTGLERISDHCSNIAACVIDMEQHNMNQHETVRKARMNNESFMKAFEEYQVKYQLSVEG